MKKWRIIPKISYCNFKKEYPNLNTDTAFNQWFYAQRFWGGRIIDVGIKYHVLSFDFRKNWIADMMGK